MNAIERDAKMTLLARAVIEAIERWEKEDEKREKDDKGNSCSSNNIVNGSNQNKRRLEIMAGSADRVVTI